MSNGSASGHKRAKIRKYVTKQGLRIPIGSSSLTLSADPITKSADATLNVPIKRSTLTVKADPLKKSVGVKLKGPLPEPRKKKRR